MKRILFSIVLVGYFVPNIVICQNIDCFLVQSILENDIVQKYLELKKISPDVIIIIDTSFYFRECDMAFFKGAKIVVSNNYKILNGNRMPYKSGYPIKGSQVLIDIFSIEKNKKKLKIYLGQVESGRYGYIVLRKKKKGYRLCKHSLGQT